jgi:hypothetical protein
VDSTGALSGEPQVVATSGSTQLDEAAVDIAKKGRYTPDRSKDGSGCFNFRMKFDKITVQFDVPDR